MQELSVNEMLNIHGGSAITTLPNFQNYAKLFKFIFKTIRSWF